MVKQQEWIDVGTVAELEKDGVRTVRGRDRAIAVFHDRGRFYAVDNRCPHMGFPLNKGSVLDGILTCHWHHARFALEGGCAFDLFADDVPAFAVRIEKGRVMVAAEPGADEDVAASFQRLRRGLDQNLSLLQAKGHLGLLEAEVGIEAILKYCLDFGSQNHETWRDGMTLLALVARLWPFLSNRTKPYVLTFASSRVADNCAGSPRRRERGSLSGSKETIETLVGWADRFLLMRHRDGLERTLLTLVERDPSTATFQTVLGGAILQRVYLDSGHLFDFLNQAVFLVDALGGGRELLASVVPLLVREAVEGMGEEDRGGWRSPLDLVEKIRAAEQRLPDQTGRRALSGSDRSRLEEELRGEDPDRILNSLLAALEEGTDPVSLARSVAFAAGWRMSRFSPANDLRDWFSPMHAFSYAAALVDALERCAGSSRLLPGLLHGAMAVFQDRFLNDPPAYYPDRTASAAVSDEGGAEPDSISDLLDQRPQLNRLVRCVAAQLRDNRALDSLADTLAWATVREDLDFHHQQVLEAALRLGSAEECLERRLLFLVAAARHLGAHGPTARNRIQSTENAIKLHRNAPVDS